MARSRTAGGVQRTALAALAAVALTEPIGADGPAPVATPEARFFSQCPDRKPRQFHHENSPWDLHGVLYTIGGLSELELLRIADWALDLVIPGRPLRPFQRTVRGIRFGYHRLPSWTLRQRLGQFVDAFQIPELSLGDASAAYTVATGGAASPTSGTIVRVEKLLDWTQHVLGDVNRLTGRVIGRREGLLRWAGPGRVVDGVQWLLLKTFNGVSLSIARTMDAGVSGIESVGQGLLNVGHRTPHRRTTVFLVLPKSVYEAHEPWIHRRRRRMVLGDRTLFQRATHAALAHRRAPPALPEWEAAQRDGAEPAVIMMTSVQVLARGPKALRAYVVPVSWVLETPDGGSD